MRFLAQLFKGPNGNWDFGRLAAFHVITAYTFAFLYALVWLGKVPGWTDLGAGYAAVLAGAVALIAGKDIGVAKANAAQTGGTP
jgi:hypothetical protein